MKVNRKEFIEALKFTMPGVTTQGRMAGSQFATLYDKAIYTASQAIAVCVTFPQLEGLRCAVNASELVTICDRLEAVELDLEEKNDKLVIKAGKAKASLGITPVNKNSPLYIDDPAWIELPSDFYDAFAACHIPGNKHILAGTCFEGNHALATDGKRVTHVDLSVDTMRFWINDAAVKTIVKYGNVFTEYALTASHLWFKGPNSMVCFAKLNEEQYRMEAVMGYYESCKRSEVNTIDIPEGLHSAILRAAPFTETIQTIHPVQLSVLQGGIQVEVRQGKDTYEETIDFDEELEIEEFTVQVDYSQLLQALKWAKEMGVAQIGDVSMLCLYGGASSTLLASLRG